MGWVIPEQGWRKGPWTPEEDKLLSEYVNMHGEGRWSSVSRCTGLNRNGKSCRLRWVNYLRPGLKKGQLTPMEEGIVVEMHALWGNKWSTIARYLPGRTDNEIKNYWRTHFKKKDKYSSKKKDKGIKTQKQPAQMQEQEAQEDDEMKRAISCADTYRYSDEQMSSDPAMGTQEMFLMYPTTSTLEDQCLSMMSQDVASWLDTIREDDFCFSQWNLDDPKGNMDYHQPTAFS